jgi:hypothetical protein
VIDKSDGQEKMFVKDLLDEDVQQDYKNQYDMGNIT